MLCCLGVAAAEPSTIATEDVPDSIGADFPLKAKDLLRLDCSDKPKQRLEDLLDSTLEDNHAETQIQTTPQALRFVAQLYPDADVSLLDDTNGRMTFAIKQRSEDQLVCRIFQQNNDLFAFYTALFSDCPAWYSFVVRPPVTAGNIFYLVEKFIPGYHTQHRTLQDYINSTQYGPREAVELSLAAARCVEYSHKSGFALINWRPSNLAVFVGPDCKKLVRPLDLTRVTRLPDVDECRESPGSVDWVALRLPNLPAFEVDNVYKCAQLAGDNHPYTFVRLRPVDVSELALTIAQILLRDEGVARDIVSEIRAVSWDEFEETQESYNDRVISVLDHWMGVAGCRLNDPDADVLTFLEPMFGQIQKIDHQQFSDFEITRSTIDTVISGLCDLTFKYLGYIENGTEYRQNDADAQHLLCRTAEISELKKISNGVKFLGQKQCVTYGATDQDGNKSIYRVFLKNKERGLHVLDCYETIKTKQSEGHIGALKYFPRVFSVQKYDNVFVVHEAHVVGCELIDFILDVIKPMTDLVAQKRSQVDMAYQVMFAVALLHEWGFTHGDIGSDNFMIDNSTDHPQVKAIDFESCVNLQRHSTCSLGGGYYNFLDLELWKKPNYTSPEIEFAKASGRSKKVVGMKLKQNDAFAIGFLALEILTIVTLERKLFKKRGVFNEQGLQKYICPILSDRSFGYKETPFEAGLFKKVFQLERDRSFSVREEDRFIWLTSHRPSVRDMLSWVERLVWYWHERR